MKYFLREHVEIIATLFIIIVSILLSCLLTCAIFYYQDQFYTETTQMIINVENKINDETTTYILVGKVLVPQHHDHYKLLWEDKEIEVSERVYNDTNTGDRIIINVSTSYSKETNEVRKICYNYAGE